MVTFPSLGLEFNINRVAFSIFEIDIYWYAILIVSAILIAFLILKINDKKCNIDYKDILEHSSISEQAKNRLKNNINKDLRSLNDIKIEEE